MRTGEAADRAAQFRDRLTAVAGRRQDATDLAAGEQRRLLSALNETAHTEAGRLAAGIRSELISLLDGELADASPGELEQRGRDWLIARARDGAEAWRDRQRKRLEEGMTELDKRLLAELRREISDVRGAAAELLDLDLAVPDTGERLVPERRFFYSGGQITGQTELFAGAVRRRLPGQLGRRRAREHLIREAGDLIPMMVGRARSDLQYRLEESGRRLARAVDARYADSIGRLVSVVDSATADSWQADLDEQAKLTDLAQREQPLREILARLGATPRQPFSK